MKRRLVGVFLAFCIAVAFALSATARDYDATEKTSEESVPEASTGGTESEGALLAGSIVASGKCGDNLTWTLDSEGTLTISGTGEMEIYESTLKFPWESYRDNVKGVRIQSGVTSISDGAFSWYQNLTNVSIPDSVLTIGERAFLHTKLTSVNLPNNLSSIAERAFCECSELTRVNISGNIITIEESAFSGCTSLTGIILPDSLKTIGDAAFYNNALTEVTIPANVTEIGENVFVFCRNLVNIHVNSANTTYKSENGALLSKDGTALIAVPNGREGNYAIPNTVKTIGKNALYVCKKITGVTIPSSVTAIEANAFCGCDKLISLNIPDSVTSVGRSAFEYC